MFFDEFLMAFRAIDAHAEKFRFGLKFAPGVAKLAGLGRTSRSIVFRIKIQNQRRTCKVRKLHLLATAVNAANCRSFEIRSRITNLKFRSHVRAGQAVTSDGPSQSTSRAPSPAIVPVTKQPCIKVSAGRSLPINHFPGAKHPGN